MIYKTLHTKLDGHEDYVLSDNNQH